jgi:hypothetical protein
MDEQRLQDEDVIEGADGLETTNLGDDDTTFGEQIPETTDATPDAASGELDSGVSDLSDEGDSALTDEKSEDTAA